MLLGHGGNRQDLAKRLGCSMDQIIDMSSNLNPLGPPDFIEPLIKESVSVVQSLPYPDAQGMRQKFARHHHLDEARVIAANGTTWFIYTIPKALKIKKALIVGPTYSDYHDACLMNSTDTVFYTASADNEFVPDMDAISKLAKQVDLVFFCNPNNPTGSLVDKQALWHLIQQHPACVFVVDESYLPFLSQADERSFVSDTGLENLIVLSSMSKIFRIPGLRTGFLTAAPDITAKVMAYYQPWSVNAIAQTVIEYIFDHPETIAPFYQQTRTYTQKEKQRFVNQVSVCPNLTLFNGHTYFILAQLTGRFTAPAVCEKVGDAGILIRNCTNFRGLSDRYIRFSLKDRKENDLLAATLQKVLADG